MKNKMGRPPIVPGQSKDVLFGVRISAEEAKEIEQGIAESGMNKSDWARDALLTKARPIWLICKKWSATDLHGKSVEVNLQTKDGKGVVRGLGRFWVMKHADGIKLAIEIHGRDTLRHLRLFLNQKLADVIERHPNPSVADFYCYATIANFQRLG
jgi:hypothetical protein